MTTTVTLKTHDWPVSVKTSDSHAHSANDRRSHGWTSTEELVPANT